MKLVAFHKSLVARITMLALITGVTTMFALVCVVILLRITTGPFATTPWLQPVLVTFGIIAIVLGIPLLIGWLASRLVTGPLRKFDTAIASLETTGYKTQLPPSSITEFDTVFARFNVLTARLREEETLRKNLISDTSHELNTPLTAISTQLTAMQDGVLPITTERIGEIKGQTDRLIELVKDLDAYTKARIPSTETTTPIHLKQACQALIDTMTAELDAAHMQAALAMPDSLSIPATRGALQHILQNLLQNAIRYSGATNITITADEYHIDFADNGKGVPVSSLPYLFERFYRVEPSRNHDLGGRGLGLAIVRELAEQQGWTIEAMSADPGLRFIITLKPQHL